MSSKSVLNQSLRRIKPEKRLARLSHRASATLPFLSALRSPFPKLLLDTTVYIDTVQGTQPEEVEIALRAASLWHSSVTEAELAFLAGRLDPSHSGTPQVIAQLASLIETRPAHRVLDPDREIWREAGILAGLLARLQGHGKNDQRKTLNDALIFLTAAKHGCAVLTRNLLDFDLLMQLEPRAKVFFYDRA